MEKGRKLQYADEVEDLKGEIWKDVKDFEGLYEVSNMGRVRSVTRKNIYKNGRVVIQKGKLLTPTSNGSGKKGYYIVPFRKDGKRSSPLVHRLVAQAFVNNSNPEEYNLINHIDEDTSNNKASNLEWCDYNYNLNYGTIRERQSNTYKTNKALGLHKKNGKPPVHVNLIDAETGERKWFESIDAAGKYLGISGVNITNVLKGRQEITRGHYAEYA